MPNASRAVVGFEGGQTPFPIQEVTSTDNRVFDLGTTQFVSKRSGFTAEVRPDGLRTGGAISPAASANADQVDVAQFNAYVSGVDLNVPSEINLAVARPVTDPFLVTSITVDNAGTVAAVQGAEGIASSETRGATGGPPLIPVGEIEIGQVRYTALASGVVAASEILAVPGLHRETADNPVFDLNATNPNGAANVTFGAALPLVHVGGVSKQVFASWFAPVFVDVPSANTFVPAEEAVTVNSTTIYRRTLGATSTTLNAATFTVFPESGIRDQLVALKGENLLFRFLEDENRSDRIITQGILGISRQFPADNNIQIDCTIAAEAPSIDIPA